MVQTSQIGPEPFNPKLDTLQLYREPSTLNESLQVPIVAAAPPAVLSPTAQMREHSHSLTRTLTPSFTLSLTHTFTHSLTLSHSHSRTHTLAPRRRSMT